ncbi:MAG TPA: polymer-forming cytoskeletal protein [Chloroflexota bacterium]|nr:polymer-forming cytoskeletal protein [Chloroflexota bacterium]
MGGVVGLFFKNRVQQDIDDFKGMQVGLRPAGRTTGRTDQNGTPLDPLAASQLMSEKDAKIIDELTSSMSDHLHTIVSGEATWEGKLRTDASARIEGTVSGEIEAGETIFIAKGAQVHANVHARRVIIAGQLEGQVTCREQLVVERSGRLLGRVSTKTIVIAEGAIVQSQIQMVRGKEPAQAVAKEPRPRSDSVLSPLGEGK